MKQKKILNTNSVLILITVIITLCTSQLVQAQQRGQQGPPPMPDDDQIEAMVEDLSKELNLTADQEKQVSEKYFSHFAAAEKKMKAGRPNREDMEKMRTEFEDDVKSVLTEDQKDLFETYLKKQKQNRPQR